MAGDLPPAPGEGPSISPAGPTQWAPVFPTPPQARSRTWPPVLLAGAAMVVAIAALIVALTRPTAAKPITTTTAPTYSAAETSAAQRRLCDTYKLAARSVETDTNGTDKAIARVALANAAGMLDDATADPAIDAKLRDAVRSLAAAYRTSNALSSVASDAEYRAALDDIVAKDAPVRNACSS